VFEEQEKGSWIEVICKINRGMWLNEEKEECVESQLTLKLEKLFGS
jgi:hypothetical protein